MRDIVKSTETMTVAHPLMLIFGAPGVGKSSIGYSAKEPLLLDVDGGAHRAANRKDTQPIDTWADVEELMADSARLEPYGSLVIDTVGRILDKMAVAIIAENPKWGQGSGALSISGWGVLKARYRTWMTQLRQLGKDVILLAHESEEKDGDTIIWRPDIQGGSYDEVMKSADLVAYVGIIGKDRILDFNPTDRHPGKNPAQWKPYVVPPVEKATDLVALIMDKGRAALGKLSEASAAVAKTVAEWRERIGKAETPEALTTLVAEHLTLAPMALIQAKALIAERAKALGFEWDKAAKKFTNPKAKEAEETTV